MFSAMLAENSAGVWGMTLIKERSVGRCRAAIGNEEKVMLPESRG